LIRGKYTIDLTVLSITLIMTGRLCTDDDDEADGNSESVVTKSQMSDLCSEAAKLKSMGVMNQVLIVNV